MVSKIYFDPPKNLATELTHYNIFDSESEVYDGIYYGMSDGKFTVMRSEGAIFWPLHETPKVAERLLPEIKKEVIGLYEIIQEKKLEERWRN